MRDEQRRIAPVDLLREGLCAPGEQQRILQRAGFAVKVCRPAGEERWLPPGQGQLIVCLSGALRVQQRTAPTGTDALSPGRDQQVRSGELIQVPNDAHWCLTSEQGAHVLMVSTSVPRTPSAQIPLPSLARRMRLRPERQLFANQKLTVSLRAFHPLLPLRRALPGDLRLCPGSALIVISGSLSGRVTDLGGIEAWSGEITEGTLLELPEESRPELRSSGRQTTAILLIEPREAPEGNGKKGPFSPFVDG